MIRIAEKHDEPFLYRMYMDPLINPWLLYEIMSAPDFSPILDDLLQRNSLYIFETDGIRKGMFKLIPQKHRNSHILYLGGVAIEPASSGKGLGRQMIEELTYLAVGSGYTRIELTVATSNQRAIHLYESCGFVNEGILRNYTYLKSEGRYIDEQVMALLLQA